MHTVQRMLLLLMILIVGSVGRAAVVTLARNNSLAWWSTEDLPDFQQVSFNWRTTVSNHRLLRIFQKCDIPHTSKTFMPAGKSIISRHKS